MKSTVSVVKLSKQAGHILAHLKWLPKEVLDVINRFPFISYPLRVMAILSILENSSGLFRPGLQVFF